MSIKQLVILSVAIVALVFLVTFASQYLGGGTKSDNKPPPGPDRQLLTFEKKSIDLAQEPMPIHEWHQDGHYNFWFENVSGADVQLGLISMDCKCSKVEVCVLPEERWKGQDPKDRARMADSADLTWERLIVMDKKGVTVPAGAGGWVRFGWKGEQLGPRTLTVSLWSQAPSSGQVGKDDLSMPVLFVEPVFCLEEANAKDPTKAGQKQDEKYLGKLSAGDSAKASFLCLSCTRPEFKLTAETTKKPPCLEVAAPEKLSDEKCQELAKQLGLPVKCGYRLLLTVHEQSSDGHQLDLGLFRYPLHLKTDTGSDPSVFVLGEVEGLVEVVSSEENPNPNLRSRIILGKFPGGQDKEFTIRLYANDKRLEMKLDGERTRATPFFEVREPKVTEQSTGRAWAVDVTIPAGTVEGPFPDRLSKVAKPGYEDCAVYLLVRKTPAAGGKADEPWRRIRVPVYGEATR